MGETFRWLLLRVGEVRSLIPLVVYLMALTATATKQLRGNVARVLGMSGEAVVARSPSKDNMFILQISRARRILLACSKETI